MSTERAQTASEPTWVGASEVSEPDRLIAIVYRIARRTGRSPAAAARLCIRLVPQMVSAPSGERRDRLAAARRGRSALADTLRTRSRNRDTGVFDEALNEAVLMDELALLPPRQRFTVWAMAIEHRTVSEVIAETGWTSTQVMRLLNAGLSTITTWVTRHDESRAPAERT
ncbi:hypothetical protein [Amycolatopsis magusensis]|uniref:Sigma-70, region 4 n=1 Tax=Amycolatopsis magusensis TaxID=882444 RepID=A0ABS4Q3V5_9PSEU|nr:hypothetical protein [Amycolatopsis magusensis]MBP2185486.1 hypothetical protein [Amycolatopsis magusensis]MDI5976496.1 hypothetical protein [Amycolatopsis magusensis]